MADLLTEEEQIEELKNWWKTYWVYVVVPIIIVGGGYFGWNFNDSYQKEKAEAGGAQYETLMETLETTPGRALSDEQIATATVLATKMVEKYSSSLYADYGNLILARLAVNAGDLPAAVGYLKMVKENGDNIAMVELATARLARIKLAQGEPDAALNLVSASNSEYATMFAEIRGDALAALGKVDAAKTAYQEAIDGLSSEEFQRRSILQIKADGAEILAGKITPVIEASPEENEGPIENPETSTEESAEKS